MAHVQVTGHQHGLYGLGQIEQAQQIAGGAARAAHGLGGSFVGEPKFLDQALQAVRFFQRVQVFALHVLDQRHGGRGLVGHIAHQHGHAVQTGQLGSAKAALASDDFKHRLVETCLRTRRSWYLLRLFLAAQPRVFVAQATHQDRLHDALSLDALCQFVQRAFVHVGTGLVLAGHHVGQH